MRTAIRTAYRNLDVLTILWHAGAAALAGIALWQGVPSLAVTLVSLTILMMVARYHAVRRVDARQAQARAEARAHMLNHMRNLDNAAYSQVVRLLDTEIDTNTDLLRANRELRNRPTTHQRIADMCDLYGHTTSNTPRLLDEDTAWARLAFIQEEVDELADAITNGDLVGIADALVDIEVFTSGTGAMYGIDMDACHAEVMRSNLAKVNPETGRFDKDENGKVGKPDGWEPPNLARVLNLDMPAPPTPSRNVITITRDIANSLTADQRAALDLNTEEAS